MLLTPHLLIGAAIGLKTHNFWLVIPISIFSHFLLDLIPHSHYDINNMKQANNKLKEFAKVILDVAFGVLLCGLLIWRSKFLIYAVAGMAASVFPDLITFIYWQTKTPLLKKFNDFHPKGLHPKKDPPLLKGLVSQVIISLIAIAFMILL